MTLRMKGNDKLTFGPAAHLEHDVQGPPKGRDGSAGHRQLLECVFVYAAVLLHGQVQLSIVVPLQITALISFRKGLASACTQLVS